MKNKLIKYGGYAVMFAAFAFLVKTVIDMHPDFTGIRNPGMSLLLGLLISAGFSAVVYLSAFAWKAILEFIHGGKIPLRIIAPVYAKANIGKYLPGNFMHFAGRNILAGRLGFTQIDIAFCSIVEIVMLVFTASIWSLLLAFRSFKTVLLRGFASAAAKPGITFAIIGILAAAIAALSVLLLKKRFFHKFHKFFTRKFLFLIGWLFVLYSITLLIPGLFMVSIFSVCFGCEFTFLSVALTAAAYTVSWVAGYIVPGVPGGLGVRESILLLILKPLYPVGIILTAVIFLRILSIAGDVIAFLAVPVLQKRWPAQTKDWSENSRKSLSISQRKSIQK